MRTAEDVLVIRNVRVDQMPECQALYANVMHLQPGDGGINARLLSAVQANGGLVLGAYAEGELVGFAYSFVGRDAHTPSDPVYQYSQLAVVAPTWQGRGVGRRLKYAQRDACLAAGITRMRWAFDPMKTRNGHFNLSVLGARIMKFVPAMYGERGFGDGAVGNTTDRFVVEWDLEHPSPAPAVDIPESVARRARFAKILRHDGSLFVPIPADWTRFRAEREWPQAERLVADYRSVFSEVLASGWVGVRCDPVSDDKAAYRFVSAADASALTATEDEA
jgi:predicted GNAT superfamily acetyltransferase